MCGATRLLFLELTLRLETMVDVNWFKFSAAVFIWVFIQTSLAVAGAEEVSRRVCNVSPLGGGKDDTGHVCTFPRFSVFSLRHIFLI